MPTAAAYTKVLLRAAKSRRRSIANRKNAAMLAAKEQMASAEKSRRAMCKAQGLDPKTLKRLIK